MHELVLGPLEMTRSTYEQPIPEHFDQNAARAHFHEGQVGNTKWHVYPEMYAAGLWTTPTDLAKVAIEVQKSLRSESNKVLSRENVREMVSPVGVGPFAVGFSIEKKGEGWYFSHGGSNWGFRCYLIAHHVKGYGLAIMTNASKGSSLAREYMRRVEKVYKWDTLDEHVRR